jgi:hypothetical protein
MSQPTVTTYDTLSWYDYASQWKFIIVHATIGWYGNCHCNSLSVWMEVPIRLTVGAAWEALPGEVKITKETPNA